MVSLDASLAGRTMVTYDGVREPVEWPPLRGRRLVDGSLPWVLGAVRPPRDERGSEVCWVNLALAATQSSTFCMRPRCWSASVVRLFVRGGPRFSPVVAVAP